MAENLKAATTFIEAGRILVLMAVQNHTPIHYESDIFIFDIVLCVISFTDMLSACALPVLLYLVPGCVMPCLVKR